MVWPDKIRSVHSICSRNFFNFKAYQLMAHSTFVNGYLKFYFSVSFFGVQNEFVNIYVFIYMYMLTKSYGHWSLSISDNSNGCVDTHIYMYIYIHMYICIYCYLCVLNEISKWNKCIPNIGNKWNTSYYQGSLTLYIARVQSLS